MGSLFVDFKQGARMRKELYRYAPIRPVRDVLQTLPFDNDAMSVPQDEEPVAKRVKTEPMEPFEFLTLPEQFRVVPNQAQSQNVENQKLIIDITSECKDGSESAEKVTLECKDGLVSEKELHIPECKLLDQGEIVDALHIPECKLLHACEIVDAFTIPQEVQIVEDSSDPEMPDLVDDGKLNFSCDCDKDVLRRLDRLEDDSCSCYTDLLARVERLEAQCETGAAFNTCLHVGVFGALVWYLHLCSDILVNFR